MDRLWRETGEEWTQSRDSRVWANSFYRAEHRTGTAQQRFCVSCFLGFGFVVLGGIFKIWNSTPKTKNWFNPILPNHMRSIFQASRDLRSTPSIFQLWIAFVTLSDIVAVQSVAALVRSISSYTVSPTCTQADSRVRELHDSNKNQVRWIFSLSVFLQVTQSCRCGKMSLAIFSAWKIGRLRCPISLSE